MLKFIFQISVCSMLFFSTWLAYASKDVCQKRLDGRQEWAITRDKMPELFKRDGSEVEIRRERSDELEGFLFKKLEEEVKEFMATPTLDEAADVAEISLAIQLRLEAQLGTNRDMVAPAFNMLYKHFAPEEVERARLAKNFKKGGFERRYLIRAIPERFQALDERVGRKLGPMGRRR